MGLLMIGLRSGIALALVAALFFPAWSYAAESPNPGAYLDPTIPGGSRLEFTVDAAGTRIERGAVLTGGFACAHKTIVTSKRASIIEGAFSYLGPVERRSGKPAGTLRWSG